MSLLRSPSAYDSREPHSVSLKVLRLSRPSLATQQPLPVSSEPLLTCASYASPRAAPTDDAFILAPVLTLPPTFGSAYVGERFSCTLCANNEQPAGSAKSISAVRIDAHMKTPSAERPVPLELDSAANVPVAAPERLLPSGQSLQRIINFALTEPGGHVLTVTVTYSETSPTSGRVRSFRKLYQFVCKNTVLVRTKATVLPTSAPTDRRAWALEAQLENSGDDPLVLTAATLETTEAFTCQSLNRVTATDGAPSEDAPTLMPGDVNQVCFLITELNPPEAVKSSDGQLTFGSLAIHWRGSMGVRGFISTEALGARVR
ncbi:hypothetical protein K3495_g7230 [Podosphaera aphanis]|nr:hypothetical protein K3495_g7230 [Podosphaera aphanis]